MELKDLDFRAVEFFAKFQEAKVTQIENVINVIHKSILIFQKPYEDMDDKEQHKFRLETNTVAGLKELLVYEKKELNRFKSSLNARLRKRDKDGNFVK